MVEVCDTEERMDMTTSQVCRARISCPAGVPATPRAIGQAEALFSKLCLCGTRSDFLDPQQPLPQALLDVCQRFVAI